MKNGLLKAISRRTYITLHRGHGVWCTSIGFILLQWICVKWIRRQNSSGEHHSLFTRHLPNNLSSTPIVTMYVCGMQAVGWAVLLLGVASYAILLLILSIMHYRSEKGLYSDMQQVNKMCAEVGILEH